MWCLVARGLARAVILLLSSLNGNNGFKLDGENNYDHSGWSVSTAGDINGDGYNDVVIGAYGYPSGYASKAAAMWCLVARGLAGRYPAAFQPQRQQRL